jgi:hypothetical protein
MRSGELRVKPLQGAVALGHHGVMQGRVRAAIVPIALATTLSGCLTFVGMGAGAIVSHERNRDVSVQRGDRPGRSVGKSIAAGGGIGLLLDVTLVVVAFATGNIAIGH